MRDGKARVKKMMPNKRKPMGTVTGTNYLIKPESLQELCVFRFGAHTLPSHQMILRSILSVRKVSYPSLQIFSSLYPLAFRIRRFLSRDLSITRSSARVRKIDASTRTSVNFLFMSPPSLTSTSFLNAENAPQILCVYILISIPIIRVVK